MQRALLGPCDRRSERRDGPDHAHGRRTDARRRGILGEARERRDERTLGGGRARLRDSDRRLRILAGRDQGIGDRREARSGHQEHERARKAREHVPVDLGALLAVPLVAGDHRELGGQATLRHGDPGERRNGDRRAEPRHDLERHPRRAQRERLLSAATEDERVAALQTHHRTPRPAVLDKARVDLVLRHRHALGRLAGVDQEGVGGREIEQWLTGQPVVDEHVGALDESSPAHRDQPRIARARADEVDGHARAASTSSRPPAASTSAAICTASAAGSAPLPSALAVRDPSSAATHARSRMPPSARRSA